MGVLMGRVNGDRVQSEPSIGLLRALIHVSRVVMSYPFRCVTEIAYDNDQVLVFT